MTARPLRNTFWLGAALLALAGCDQAKKGFDDGFRKSFHDKFMANCQGAAIAKGVPAAGAKALCACSEAKLEARHSIQELSRPDDAEMRSIAAECMKETPL